MEMHGRVAVAEVGGAARRVVSLLVALVMVAAVVAVGSPAAEASVVDTGWDPGEEINRDPSGGWPEDGGQRVAERQAEVLSRRTASSRTFALSSGGFETELFPSPVHFRDGQGRWVPFDNRVRPDESGGWTNTAGDHVVRLPQQASGQLRIGRGQAWIGMTASGAQAVQGTAEEFGTVYPGAYEATDLRYRVTSTGAAAAWVLAGPQAPATFTLDVQTSPGLTLTDTGVLLNAEGATVGGLSAPFAQDASTGPDSFTDQVQMTVAPAGENRWTVTKTVDPTWLAAPDRAWPVTVDPLVSFEPEDASGEQQDCLIYSDDSTQDRCDWAALRVWDSSSTTKEYRSLLQFDVRDRLTAIEGDEGGPVLVRAAELGLQRRPGYETVDAEITLHQVTEDWDEGHARWNRRLVDGSGNDVPWSTAGGTFESSPPRGATDGIDDNTTGDSPWTGGTDWEFWYPTELVQHWFDGTDDFGLLLDTDSGNWVDFYSVEASDPATWPTLKINWERGLGTQKDWSYTTFDLNPQQRIKVNLANRNMLLEQTDASVAGVAGHDLTLSRTYNELSANHWGFAKGWHGLAPQNNMGLWKYGDDSRIAYRAMDGWTTAFINDGTGWDSVKPMDATLTEPATSTSHHYQLEWHRSETKYHYHSNGHLTQIEDRHGNTIDFNYTGFWEIASITDSRGRVFDIKVLDTSSEPDRIQDITDPAGRVHDYNYKQDLLDFYSDPDGHKWDYDYDAEERLATVTDPEGNQTLFTYDPAQGELASITRVDDPANGTGPTWQFASAADCTTIDASYRTDRCTVVTDPEGGDTIHYLNEKFQVTETIDQLGRSTSKSYTTNGDVATATDGLTNTTTFDYAGDGTGNPTGMTMATGASASIEYTDPSNPYSPTKTTDTQDNTLLYGHDSAGRVTDIDDDQGPYLSWDIDYTSFGAVDTITDPASNVTDLDYNTDEELESRDPAGPIGATTFTYDSLSRVKTSTDPRGITTTYGYDKFDRVVSIDHGTGVATTYTYDKVGKRTERTVDDGTVRTTSWGYDDLNRLETEQMPGRTQVTYTYDPNGNLASFTDAAGTVGYDHDAANQLTTVTEPDSDTVTFDHDDAGNRTEVAYPNGVTQTMDYDNANRLERITGTDSATTVLTDRAYTYTDPTTGLDTMLRHTQTDHVAGLTIDYDYDHLNRLTSATGGPSDYSYTYDSRSNRETRTIDGTTTSYSYNDANQLTSDGTTTFTYDNAGNRTAGTAGGHTYDDANRTETIGTTYYTYAGVDQTQRLTRTRGSTTEYTPTSLGLAGEQTGGYQAMLRDDQGRLLGQLWHSDSYYYLYDGQGSTLAVTDDTGAVVADYTYGPYGEAESVSQTFSNTYRYVGQLGYYYDGTTGLYLVGHRIYQPDLGTWTQPDPSGAEANTYLYAAGDPINRIDATGLHWTTWAGRGLELFGAADLAYDLYRADSTRDYFVVGATFWFEATVTATCAAGVIGVTGGIGSYGVLGCSAAGGAAGAGVESLAES